MVAVPEVMRRLGHVVTSAEDGTRLEDCVIAVLAEALGRPVGRGEARRLIMAGVVRLDGRPQRRPGLILRAGARLTGALDTRRLARRARAPRSIDAGDLLYEDRWLVAVNKPPGLPTHVTADPSRPHLVGLVLEWLQARDGAAGAPRLGVHQRLDRDTSGIVLLTKDPAADAGLARQFADRVIGKTYHALTIRPAVLPPAKWRVSARIETPGGPVEAVTDFERRESLAQALLIEAFPRTGRKHQIRIHLAGMGLPILGEDRHGPGTARPGADRLMLHAARLDLRHPIDDTPLRIECPWPSDFAGLVHRQRRAAKLRKG
jgi:23S rRNA pseudouridine1911/1915/1917 synthase